VRLTDAQRRAHFGLPTDNRVIEYVVTPWGPRVGVHRLIKDVFLAACQEAHDTQAWKPRRIDSHVDRQIRGSAAWSLHAYGLAFDFFDRPFPTPVDVWGPTNAPPRSFRDVFQRHGFFPGANFSGRKDYPHLEWATAPPKPVSPPKPSEPDVTPQDHAKIAQSVVDAIKPLTARLTKVEQATAATQKLVSRNLPASGMPVEDELDAIRRAMRAVLEASGVPKDKIKETKV
jgi:hypothetical protein